VCDSWLRCPRPCRQPTCIQLPLPYRITLGSEDRPQGGRGGSGSAWVQETFDLLTERESRFEGNGGIATLRSRAASNWTQSGPAGNSQRPSNLHIICKNSSLNEDHAGEHRRSAGRRTLPRQAAAEAPRLLRGRQLAAAGAEGLQLVAVSDRRTRQLER